MTNNSVRFSPNSMIQFNSNLKQKFSSIFSLNLRNSSVKEKLLNDYILGRPGCSNYQICALNQLLVSDVNGAVCLWFFYDIMSQLLV